MAELSEQQLLLLDSLVYADLDFPAGTPVSEIVYTLQEANDAGTLKVGGGMETQQDVADMLNAIAADEQLMSMEITHYTNTDIRGACFVDGDGDAVIAFRGTGPAYLAWDDNCQAGYLSDTDMQKEALAFAQECAKDYDNITVTGHSKGGNMAQYVTVLMGDEIDRCVSFDGQGFSDEFLEKYEAEIEANRGKIRSVCAYNDYVNILLTPIASEIVYLDNAKTGKGGHYVFELYRHENNKMVDGEYVTSRKQDPVIAIAKKALDEVIKKIDGWSLAAPFAEFLIYTAIGIIMGGLLNGETDFDVWDIIKAVLDNYEDYDEYKATQQIAGKELLGCYMTVDTQVLKNYSGTLSTVAGQIEMLEERIRKVRKNMATNLIDGVAIGLPLQVVLNQLSREVSKLRKLSHGLTTCADLYESAETTAKSKVPG